MRRIVLVVLVVLGAALGVPVLASSAGAIINGDVVGSSDSSLAFVGRLEQQISKGPDKGKTATCTASLIAPAVAITAKHCTERANRNIGCRTVDHVNAQPDSLAITFGISRLGGGQGGVRSHVSQILRNGDADIALLVLSKPVPGIQPVNFMPSDQAKAIKRESGPFLAVGWGQTSIDQDGLPAELRSASNFVVGRNAPASDQGLKSKFWISTAPGSVVEGNFESSGKYSFHGDSGGPLLDLSQGAPKLIATFVEFQQKSASACANTSQITANYWIDSASDGNKGVHNWIEKKVASVQTPPSEVLNLRLSNDSKSILWDAPASDGRKPILGYYIYLSANGADISSSQVDPSQRSFSVPGRAGTFSLSVTAFNAAGEGPPQTVRVTDSIPTPPSISGKVWVWGSNDAGMLAGAAGDRYSTNPVGPVNLPDAKLVTAAGGSGYALRADGRVSSWGSNYGGALGNGSTQDSSTPVEVSGLTSVVSISGGGDQAYALKSDGTVWAWGGGAEGALGRGSTADSAVPVQVSGLSAVVAIAGHAYGAYALKSDGSVWSWGSGDNLAVGNGDNKDALTPVAVRNLQGVKAIAAGSNNGYALLADGTVWAWGNNSSGQLGDGTQTSSSLPVRVSGISGVISLFSGSSANTAYAVTADGNVWAWGNGLQGQLGNGSTADSQLTPTAVNRIGNVIQVAAGVASAYAVTADGRVWSWGRNFYGELGNGGTRQSSAPVLLSITNVLQIASSSSTAIALVGAAA